MKRAIKWLIAILVSLMLISWTISIIFTKLALILTILLLIIVAFVALFYKLETRQRSKPRFDSDYDL